MVWSEAKAAPRRVVGFEVILGAYSPLSIAAMTPVSLTSLSLAMDPFGEVAAVTGDPFVVHVDHEMTSRKPPRPRCVYDVRAARVDVSGAVLPIDVTTVALFS